MEMTEGTNHVVEKKIYEEGKKHDEYASKGIAGTGLGLGIAGTALGLGAWLFGNNRSPFGSLCGGNMPDNVNINAFTGGTQSAQAPTALQVLEKENADELALVEKMYDMKLDTANKFYAMREADVAEKFSLYKGGVDALNAENRRAERAEFGLYKSQIEADFGLYKNQRDQFDVTNGKICALEKKIAVMEALEPYKEKIILQAMALKTAYNVTGQLVLPSTPTVTGYGSYCCCHQPVAAPTTAPTTGA